ncbi:MAG: ABC transporter permease subunit [Planctomycetota bacterium]
MTSTASGTRRRPTSRRVLLTDRLAEAVITVGGFIVLAAVMGIGVYLAVVVAPLFGSAKVGETIETPARSSGVPLAADPFGELVAVRAGDAQQDEIHLLASASGELLARHELAPAEQDITAFGGPETDERIAVGFADGRVATGTLRFDVRVAPASRVPEGARSIEVGQRFASAEGSVQRLDPLRFRWAQLEFDMLAPADVGLSGAPISHVSIREGSVGRQTLAARDETGAAVIRVLAESRGLGARSGRLRPVSSVVFEAPDDGAGRAPIWFGAMRDGDSAMAVWADGSLARFGPDPETNGWGQRERITVADEVTAVAPAPGGRTLMIGDAEGAVHLWHVARDALSPHGDERRLVRARSMPLLDEPVARLASSSRERIVLASGASGRASMAHLTSGKRFAQFELAPGLPSGAVAGAVLTRGGDRAVAITRTASGPALQTRTVDASHPEASWTSLFGLKQYEGESEASFVYQSSSAEDAAEVKMSLIPLVFGTLKATVFAMLFATPIAVLAAIYSSEFLRPETRRVVKPAVEMMASLPSVVLGFVAAVLVAPLVRDHLVAVVLGLAFAPLAVLFGAHVWQVVPARVRLRLSGGGRRLMLVAIAIFLAVGSLVWAGPAFERALFSPSRADVLAMAGSVRDVDPGEAPSWAIGREALDAAERRDLRAMGLALIEGRVVRPTEPDTADARAALAQRIAADGLDQGGMRRWLDGAFGDAWAGWMLLCTPVGWAFMWFAGKRMPHVLARSASASESLLATEGLLRFVAGVLLGVGLGAAGAWALTSLGWDPRSSIFGPFSQRNAMVVGIIMGFAVIPIIYTLADDAMTSVPDSLRSASIGAGATRWQTALRVVTPVAGSGIFSAIMIGLGRAVGETMIVLMATGNTPVMDWNLFEGLRTLAANIAVELPEAPPGGTHYRVLFLCGLTLFVLTFFINTTAEAVRQRFRKRSAAL